MKNLTTLLSMVILFISLAANAQTTLALKQDNPALESQAETLTKRYDEQLALRAKQYLLFKNKVEEYFNLSEAIKENYTGTEMLDRLYGLQQTEIADMNDILTRLQWNRYKEIRPFIQPLAKTENK